MNLILHDDSASDKEPINEETEVDTEDPPVRPDLEIIEAPIGHLKDPINSSKIQLKKPHRRSRVPARFKG